MKHLLAFSLVFGAAFVAQAKVKSAVYEYQQGTTQFEGYLASPAAKGDKKRTGVLLIHQWKGLGEYEKQRAQQLAEEGYVILAADIYGKGVRPQTAEAAGKQAGQFKGNRALFRERLKLAYDELAKQSNVDLKKIVVMGYCFGGTGALELARSGVDLVGTASFHGGLDSLNPQEAKNIKGSVIVFHGAVDPFVSAKDLEAFQKELNDAKVDYQFVSYANAVHSFTDKGAGADASKGAAYNELADKRSWTSFLDFLAEVSKN